MKVIRVWLAIMVHVVSIVGTMIGSAVGSTWLISQWTDNAVLTIWLTVFISMSLTLLPSIRALIAVDNWIKKDLKT